MMLERTLQVINNWSMRNARYDHMQILRGIACIMVVFDHAAPLLINGIPNHENSAIDPFLIPQGFQWVWLFLVISGYLITKAFVSRRFSLNAAGIKSFYINRF